MRRALVVALGTLLVACTDGPARSRPLPPHLRPLVLDAPPPSLAHASEATWFGTLRLLGWRTEPALHVTRGQPVRLSLYWQTMGVLPRELAVTTRLVAPDGTELARLDDAGPLRERGTGKPALPPSDFQKGKVYEDTLSFVMPDNAPDGAFVRVGLERRDERVAPTYGTPDVQGRVAVARLEVRDPVPEVPSLRVPKLDGKPPVIDGNLDDEAWTHAASTEAFVDVNTGEPSETFPASGSARLTWTDEALYLAFRIRDENLLGGTTPEEKKQKDPHVWEKECVEIMIDPDGDGDNLDYYEVQVSTENLVFDSQFDRYNAPRGGPNGPFGHEEWTIGGKTAVKVVGTLDDPSDKDEGYTVEVMIPWTSLAKAQAAPPRPGDAWRMNFYAMKKNGGVAWSPIRAEGNFHKASRFGRVVFVEPSSP